MSLKKCTTKKDLALYSGISLLTFFLMKKGKDYLRVSNKKDLLKIILNSSKVRLFSYFKIPMLYLSDPIIEEISDNKCVVRIPLKHRTKNHLNSMYFGVLSIGADCTGGAIAMDAISKSKEKVSMVFKDFKADFLKRAEGDVLFICEQGQEIRELVNKAVLSGERENLPINIIATVPSKGEEPVAKFVLTLSIKKKN